MHCPWRHTAQGACCVTVQGTQQSDVWVHPLAKNGMQVAGSQMPVPSGLVCWQTSPGPQTGGGSRMFPPHGPPGPETHRHVGVAVGELSHAAPVGQVPPHVPAESRPHGLAHSAAGPGQQVTEPAETQTQPCSQMPWLQVSTVHGFPSSQSPSVWQAGSVVLVVVTVVVVVSLHAARWRRHAPAAWRKQSFGYVFPSQPHTGATKSGHT